MDWLLAPRMVPLLIVLGAPLAGAIITQFIKALKPRVQVFRAWVIATYVVMVIQAIAMFFALGSVTQ